MNEAELRQACEESGLSVDRLEDAGDVLVVVPRELAGFPDADSLDALGRRLRELSGKRYVTVDIGEEVGIDEAGKS